MTKELIATRKRILVCLSYSEKDDKEKDRLLSHLDILRQAGMVDVWSIDQILPGDDWEQELNQQLASAQIIILLITANFLASDFAHKHIFPQLRKRQSENVPIFVVIARPCTWQIIDWLTQTEIRPKNRRAIWGGSDYEIDQALADIAGEIANLGISSRPVFMDIPLSVVQQRRIDAALPGGAVDVGETIDLLVQVRFPNSLLLGIEDWPTEQKPTSLKQRSESLFVEFPVDSETGALSSTHLLIKVVTGDFELLGSSERLIEVPPYQYSKLVDFLLKTKKPGRGRVNVEVYSENNHLFLGTIPIETVVGAEKIPNPERVASLALLFGVDLELPTVAPSDEDSFLTKHSPTPTIHPRPKSTTATEDDENQTKSEPSEDPSPIIPLDTSSKIPFPILLLSIITVMVVVAIICNYLQ